MKREYSKTNLIVLGFNDKSTLVAYFMSSAREREKRGRKDSRGVRERDGRKRKMNESKETEEIKTFRPLPLPTARTAGLAQL